MKKITLCLTIFAATLAYSQNLATNGDFESVNPFDGGTPSILSTTYADNGYFKRNKASAPSVEEDNDNTHIIGTRGAVLPTGVNATYHMRYGINYLTQDIKYTVKLDIKGEGDVYNKKVNVAWKEGSNVSVGNVGSSYSPTLNWQTWSGLLDYASASITDPEQYLHMSLNINTVNPTTYFDNLQIFILACLDENIEVETAGTSALSIYTSDMNNGASVSIGSNANLTSHTFYEADGTTNADSKFTLNADGSITSTGGTEDTEYKITYKLTSTSDADSSGTNDWDEITQTFKVAAPVTYLPEKLDYTFDTPGDLEGWADNTFVGAPTVVADGNMTITFPELPVDENSAVKTILDQTLNSVNPQNNDYVYIRYKNNSDNETFRFQITNNNIENQGYVIDGGSFITNTSGYEVLQIDLSAQAKWSTAANATSFQIQIRNEVLQANNLPPYTTDITSPGTLIIDRIIFSSESTYEAAIGTLGINDITQKSENVTLHPNPVKNSFTISTINQIEKIEVFNLLGQKVLTSNSNKVDVSHLNRGMYVSKIYQDNGIISTKQFIKN